MTESTHLHLRFAVATAAVIALAGSGLFWFVRGQEVKQAEKNVTRDAHSVEAGVLRDELRVSDLRRPASGARLKLLDKLFATRVLSDERLRVKLYGKPDGLVTYSNVHSLIGTRTDDPAEFAEVLAGADVRDVTHLNTEGGTGKNVKALEVYVPLRLPGRPRADGVLEIYQSYAPVASAVRSFDLPFALLLLLTLAAMWLALFPLVRRMVRAMDRSSAARRATELTLEQTSEQLRQTQKMEAIGQLTGAVAHDFNNLLLAINGYSDLLSDSLAGDEQKRYASEIRGAAQRAAALTQQLLAFSRKQVLQPRIIDLNESVREIESILRRLIGDGVQIEIDLAPRLRRIEADPNQIGQSILNLAINARDAMPDGGTLRIETRDDGDTVVLEISDTGIGMDDETRARIFEPFFTTKEVGQGTGLGLSTVFGIISQSGGTIDVRSAPGDGTTFAIHLPPSNQETEETAPIVTASPGAGERILLVDDERLVRDLLAQLLRDQGYNVTAADSAREALAIGGSWDLLITDVAMPGANGVGLAKQIGAKNVLFISGYDQTGLVESDAAFLQKPFDRDDLTRTVRNLLDPPSLTGIAA